jgi:glycosyltransferase involved in cell wall biosynthesis
MPSSLLLPLPHGLSVAGVTSFAVRLANGLAARGRAASLLIHPEPRGSARVGFELHPRVEVVRPDLPSFEASAGDLSPFIPVYRDTVRRLAAQTGSPVAFAPQLYGDCYGIAAALCLAEPEPLRVLGWQHGVFEYDTRVLTRYEPIISRFIAVSDRIETTLKQRLPHRAADIANIPCGVQPSPRDPSGPRSPAPLRLIYTGRIEHHAKRILALAHLADELSVRGIAHAITAVGDGPASVEFDAAIASRPTIRRLPPQSPGAVGTLLAGADAFILPSRMEGLSVSMLEAMAAGCVPILTKTDSGAMQVIEPGYNGEIADVSPEAGEAEAAVALAGAIQKFLQRAPEKRAAMAAAARQTVADRFSLDRHIAAVAALIDAATASPARAWPADRPCAFTASSRGDQPTSGSVPPDGPRLLRSLLESLAGRTVIIHGTGQHTLQLASVLAASPARIAAFTDDDRQRHGQKLWNWPIVAPADTAKTGATDVVISSWMHQDAIWARREMYVRQGMEVHKIYP